MKDYIIEINIPCLSYGSIFLVKANNKKEAKQKIYDYCKDIYKYKKSDVIAYSLEELYKSDNSDIVEIN